MSLNNAADTLSPVHATALAVLVELEARWENLRAAPARTAAVRSTTQDLHSMQKAYEAFRAHLAAFNKRYPPGHVPELLLNSPARLAVWCRRMLDLYARVADDPRAGCPVHLLAKAQRCADKIAGRLGTAGPARETPSDVRAAIRALAAVGQWCDGLTGVEIGAGQP